MWSPLLDKCGTVISVTEAKAKETAFLPAKLLAFEEFGAASWMLGRVGALWSQHRAKEGMSSGHTGVTSH